MCIGVTVKKQHTKKTSYNLFPLLFNKKYKTLICLELITDLVIISDGFLLILEIKKNRYVTSLKREVFLIVKFQPSEKSVHSFVQLMLSQWLILPQRI